MTEHMALCLHVAEKHDILLAEKQDVSVLINMSFDILTLHPPHTHMVMLPQCV